MNAGDRGHKLRSINVWCPSARGNHVAGRLASLICPPPPPKANTARWRGEARRAPAQLICLAKVAALGPGLTAGSWLVRCGKPVENELAAAHLVWA